MTTKCFKITKLGKYPALIKFGSAWKIQKRMTIPWAEVKHKEHIHYLILFRCTVNDLILFHGSSFWFQNILHTPSSSNNNDWSLNKLNSFLVPYLSHIKMVIQTYFWAITKVTQINWYSIVLFGIKSPLNVEFVFLMHWPYMGLKRRHFYAYFFDKYHNYVLI